MPCMLKELVGSGLSFVGAKLDMSKAYDHAKWAYVINVMRSMRWMNLIYYCMSTVSHVLLINGKQCGVFTPERGIKQGDLLSLFVFMLVTNGLSALIRRSELNDMLRGFKVSHNAPKVTHLFFADNSLLFIRMKRSDCDELLRILKVYEEASGQTINHDKSSIWFSTNTSTGDKDMVCGVVGIRGVFEHENYLGLPLSVGRRDSRELNYLVDQNRSKVTCWNVRYLSEAGKETLIKHVAQAMPIYSDELLFAT